MLLALLLLATLALAWANGANDNFKATATVYGSGALDHRSALRLATAAQIAGSLASVLLASALLHAFSGRGLVPSEVVAGPAFLVAVAAGAALTVALATRAGLPISTTHALVGGLGGAGLALAPAGIAWSAFAASYFLPLALSPLVACAAAALGYPLAHRARLALGVRADTCVCLGAQPQPADLRPDGTLVLRLSGAPLTVAEVEACRRLYRGRLFGGSVQTIADAIHRVSAFALGFARALNDTPKVLALLVAAGWSGIDPRASLLGVALCMAAGGWLRSRAVAETLSRRITSLGHGQGLLANLVSSSLVVGASLAGTPVSTTHVSTGALFGIGLWNDDSDWRVVGGILAAWLVTLPVAAALAAAIAWALGGAS